jgi:hypothetical protein
MDKNTIILDGKEYILKSSVKLPLEKAKLKNNMKYCIIRTYSAGVFAGYIEKRSGKEAKLREARRLWYWKGANSLSDLALNGVKNPAECKFSGPVDEIVTEVIEILEVTEKAKQSVAEVKIWAA